MHSIARLVMGVIGVGILYQLGSILWSLRRCQREVGAALQFTPGNLRSEINILLVGELLFIVGFGVFLVGALFEMVWLINVGESIVLVFFILVMAVFRGWRRRLQESLTR